MCFAKTASAPTSPAPYALNKSETAVTQKVAPATPEGWAPEAETPQSRPRGARVTGLFHTNRM